MRRRQRQRFVAQSIGSNLEEVFQDLPATANRRRVSPEVSVVALVHERDLSVLDDLEHAGVRIGIHNGQQLRSAAALGQYPDLVGTGLAGLDRQGGIAPKESQQLASDESQQRGLHGDIVLDVSLALVEDSERQRYKGAVQNRDAGCEFFRDFGELFGLHGNVVVEKSDQIREQIVGYGERENPE